MISEVDDIIRGLGVNPYFVTLGLLITIGPIAWRILKGVWFATLFVFGAIQLGLKNQIRRRIWRSIRGSVKKNEFGFFGVYELSNSDIYIKILDFAFWISFTIGMAPIIYLLTFSRGASAASSITLLYVSVSGLVYQFSLLSDLAKVYWRKKFALRGVQKSLRAARKRLALLTELVELEKQKGI